MKETEEWMSEYQISAIYSVPRRLNPRSHPGDPNDPHDVNTKKTTHKWVSDHQHNKATGWLTRTLFSKVLHTEVHTRPEQTSWFQRANVFK